MTKLETFSRMLFANNRLLFDDTWRATRMKEIAILDKYSKGE